MTEEKYIATLFRARRIWAIGPVHGNEDGLRRFHTALFAKLKKGDRLVYLGNLIGIGKGVGGVMDQAINFRRAFLAGRGTFTHDIIFLRGAQEEMWQRLLQLQFSINPIEVLDWMLDHGLETTIQTYGGTAKEAQSAARQGTMAITRWIASLRSAMQARPGHQELLLSLKHAAITDDKKLLFVSRGLDPAKPLDAQVDAFWWGHPDFDLFEGPYGGFLKVVNGFNNSHSGVIVDGFRVHIDGGARFGGAVIAGCVDETGALVDSIEA